MFQRNASLGAGNQWKPKQRLTGNEVGPTSSFLCATNGGGGGMVFGGSKLVCGDDGQGYGFAFDQTSDEWAVEGILQPDTSKHYEESRIAISGDKKVMGCQVMKLRCCRHHNICFHLSMMTVADRLI